MKTSTLKCIAALLVLSTVLCGCGGSSSPAATSATEGEKPTASEGIEAPSGTTATTLQDTSSEPPQTTTASQCQHTFGSWMTTKEATCLDKGEQVHICSKCSFAEMGELKALGHTTEAGICERCKENIGADLAQSIRDIIEIYEVYPSAPNSAGGVNMNVAFSNTSDKVIKYIHFNVTPYNAVGDSVKCEIRDYYSFTGYVTGPLEAGYEGYSRFLDSTSAVHSWENAWYNYSIKSLELNSVRIEYMDGSTYSLSGDKLKLAFTDYPIDHTVTDLGSRTGFEYDEENEWFRQCHSRRWIGSKDQHGLLPLPLSALDHRPR